MHILVCMVWRRLSYPAILYLLTLAAFWRVSLCEFTNHDDPEYVYCNPHVVSGLSAPNLAWAFGTLHGGISYWHPLTWISHQMDCQFFGVEPGAQHLTSLWIHVVNVMLVYALCSALDFGKRSAFFVAALFAVHPLHAESVAWIAERKDVLFACFWILALLSYIRHLRCRSVRWYFGALGLFICALMSKPSAITLPLVLGLLEFWPYGEIHLTGRSWRNLVKLAPFCLLSIAIGLLTIKAQTEVGAVQSLAGLPLTQRLDNVAVSLITYLRKTVYPSDLCVSYVTMHPLTPGWVIAAVVILSGASMAAWKARRRCPRILFGWLWFVLTISPNLGIVQVGAQSMADRYTYLPLIGVFVMLIEVGRQGAQLLDRPRLVTCAGVVMVLFYAGVCYRQIDTWRNGVTLFTRAVEVDETNWVAQLGLGMALTERGRFEEALPHLERAVELPGNRAEARRKLAICLEARAGR